MRTIKSVFEMTKFGMGNNLFTFRDKYYQYGKSEDLASYIINNSLVFSYNTKYNGI